jgi:hypothetical protein
MGAVEEALEKAAFCCPGCGKTGDNYPCPSCFTELTPEQREKLEESKTIISALKEYARMKQVDWKGRQYGKLIGTRDADGEPIRKTGCLLLVAAAILGVAVIAISADSIGKWL